MKELFEKAELEILKFSETDIIQTSNEGENSEEDEAKLLPKFRKGLFM